MTSNPLFGSVELKNMNETSHDHESNIDDAVSALERKKKILNQLDMPWTVETSKFEPTFFKYNGKIVKYDSKGLAIWRVKDDFFFSFPFLSIILGLSKCISHNHLRLGYLEPFERLNRNLLSYHGYLHWY